MYTIKIGHTKNMKMKNYNILPLNNEKNKIIFNNKHDINYKNIIHIIICIFSPNSTYFTILLINK